MPGPRVPVIATGGNLPKQGRFYPAYKTALRELGVESTLSERKRDRRDIKEGKPVVRGGFSFSLAPS